MTNESALNNDLFIQQASVNLSDTKAENKIEVSENKPLEFEVVNNVAWIKSGSLGDHLNIVA